MISLDLAELHKAEAGLTCMSLLFNVAQSRGSDAEHSESCRIAARMDAPTAAIEVADLADALIVEGAVGEPALTAECFWGRRRSAMTAAYGSPNTPRTEVGGVKPGKV